MSWFQTLLRYKLFVPANRRKVFILELLKNVSEFDDVSVDEPIRGRLVQRIRVGGWVFLVSNWDDKEIQIEEYPEKANTPDDNSIMDLIAKYADDGYIEMVSESGVLWRWVFKNGRSHVIVPTIIWPEVKVPETNQE